VREQPTGPIRTVLERLCALYGLTNILDDRWIDVFPND
jgi:acyl-CoA oxidase